MWENLLFNITLFVLLYGIGNVISKKTKGIIPEALFLSVVYLIGFLTGLFPEDTLTSTGVPAMISAFGLMLMVTNLGTMIELRRFIQEWRTVLICLGALLVMSILFCTVGIAVFGREYALCALPPVSGGIMATSLVVSAAEAAGMTDYAAFASLLNSLQVLIAVPVSSFLLHKYCDGLYASKSYLTLSENAAVAEQKGSKFRIIKHFPDAWNNGPMMVARLLLVTLLGSWLSTITNGTLPAAVNVLVLGVIFTELGFLEPQTLSKAGWMEFLLMGLVMLMPHGFRNLTLESFGSMLLPVVFFLLLGAASLILGGLLMGRILKVDWRLSAAYSLAAMFGYPLTEIVSRSVVGSYDLPADEEEKMLGAVMPQMIVAGFTAVTVASVVLAGFIAPRIFG
ncbi:MAG: hypothetical protein ACI3XD_07420 [Oscillospiraceae bacterium]